MASDKEAAVVLRLKRVPMFSKLEDSTLLQIARECRHARFREGMYLFYENQEAPGLHVILSGEVALHRSLGTGETLSFAKRRSGDVLGEISLLDKGTATASAVAKTDVLAAIIRPSEFERLLARQPTIALTLLRALASRLREATALLASAHRDSIPQRVAELILNECDDEGNIRLESQRIIGERLGGSREAINRALKEFCDRGALTKGKKSNEYRVNRPRLMDIAGK